MRFLVFLLVASLAIVDLACAQSIDVGSNANRPALVGNGPDALINQIDFRDLFQKGQKDAGMMFACTVEKSGTISWYSIYRATPNSDLLQAEVTRRLETAKFTPALYKKEPVAVVFFGTVVYFVKDGKPHLRIYANQESEELNKRNDFIGPQPYFGGESTFSGLNYPYPDLPVPVAGLVDVTMAVDVTGKLKDIQLLSENPPVLGFGDAALASLRFAKFIPAFRNGKPVESKVTLSIYYKPPP
jgi:hypothetical protein